MRGAPLAGGHAAGHPGAVGDRLLGVEGALRAGEALADYLGVLDDQTGHQAASRTALTTFSAPSASLSAQTIGRSGAARSFLPSSPLVPSRSTTRGHARPTKRRVGK